MFSQLGICVRRTVGYGTSGEAGTVRAIPDGIKFMPHGVMDTRQGEGQNPAFPTGDLDNRCDFLFVGWSQFGDLVGLPEGAEFCMQIEDNLLSCWKRFR